MLYFYYLFYAIICVLFLWISLYGCYQFVAFLYFRKIINKFPGAKVYFLGDIVYLSKKQDILFKQLREKAKQFPNGYRLWGAIYACFNILKPVDFEVILSSPKYIAKDYLYNLLVPWLRNGLLTSKGVDWHRRRKILTPAFHFNVLRKFVKIFAEHTEKFVEELTDECNKSKTNIEPIVSKLTLALICETAMGVKFDENSADQRKYRQAIHELGKSIVERVSNCLYYCDWLYAILPHGRKFFKNIKILHEFTYKVIKEREANFEDKDVLDLDKDDEEMANYGSFSKKRFAMLDLLISAKRNTGEIDDDGIHEEVDTFMFEGHDTTAMALIYAIFCLANYRDVQEKARHEVDGIFGDSLRSPDYHDLQKMIYMDMVLREVLRLYPSVPLISRTMWEFVPLRNGKYVMPPSSFALLHIYDLHRDPEIFENPEKFDPDRFLPENCKNRNPYAYVPFSAGPRNCIGQKFAMLEMKTVISSILRNFEIEPVDTPETLKINVDLVLRPANGLYVKFKPRSK